MISSTNSALDRVKEAEDKASFIIKEAEDEAQRIILDAKLDSKEMFYWAEADSAAEAHRILTGAKSYIEKELAKITKNTQVEKEELENKAKANMAKAMAFIVKELLKLYGCSKT